MTSIRKQILQVFRNRAIDARIRQLEQAAATPSAKAWADMDDTEREKQVRAAIALRHAIERMKQMKDQPIK